MERIQLLHGQVLTQFFVSGKILGFSTAENLGRISTKQHFMPTLHNLICAKNFSLKKGHEVCARGLEDASNMILINNNKTNTWPSLSTWNLHFTNSDVPLMFALFCRRSFLSFRNRSLPSPLYKKHFMFNASACKSRLANQNFLMMIIPTYINNCQFHYPLEN